MGLLRRRGRPATEADATQVGEDVFVVSRKAADLAVKAQKERRRAALAARHLAETQEATLLGDKKAHVWKAAYHSVRALVETAKRLRRLAAKAARQSFAGGGGSA